MLVPQSMSGLEAIYWAQKYPDEVKAIIGLDAAVPDVYLHSSFEAPGKIGTYIMNFISRLGLTRVITRFASRESLEEQYPLLKSDALSKKAKEKIIPLFHRSYYTKNMVDEGDYILGNARKIKDRGVPVDTPMYFFIAEGSADTIMPEWKEVLSGYASKSNYGEFKILDCEHHNLHYEKNDIISDEIKDFLEEIDVS